MPSKNRFRPPDVNRGQRVGATLVSALDVMDRPPTFAFHKMVEPGCDYPTKGRYLDHFRALSSLTWKQIRADKHQGYGLEPIPVTQFSARVPGTARQQGHVATHQWEAMSMPRLTPLSAVWVALGAALTVLTISMIAVAQSEEESDAATSLVARFPPTLEGSEVQVIAFTGEEWLAGFDPTDEGAQEFRDYVADLGVVADALGDDVALASGLFVDGDGHSSAVTAIQVCGADAHKLVSATLGLYAPGQPPAVTEQVIAGVAVQTGTATTEDGTPI